jgi:hypothetical protein
LGLRPERFPIKWTRLQDWPIGQHIGRHVDFVLGAVDQGNVNAFKILARCIVNGRRGLGFAWRARGEQEASRDAGGGRAAWHQSKPHQVEESKKWEAPKERRLLREEISLFQASCSPACAGIEFQDRLGFLSVTPRGTPEVGRSIIQESFFLQPIGHDLLNKMRHRAPIVLCCFFERRPNILIEANA